MDFALTEEEKAFAAEVRAFLEETLTDELRNAGRNATSVFTDINLSLEWQRLLNARGWAAPAWPKEYGGPGWTDMQRHIFASECARASAPPLAPMGMKMVAPVIMGYGDEAQKKYYLPRILSGEDYWCQGYSEPGAGSDLVSLQLRADADGEDYILNGTKIWTTHAHWANKMFCLVRTDREARPHAGITFLLLDMKSPGITVQPIITLAGEHEVNQVFFDNVRVPKINRLGAENQGWSVAKYLLAFERGGASAAGLRASVARLRRWLADADVSGGEDEVTLAVRLAAAEIEVEAIDVTELRALTAFAAGQNPGPISSLLKVQSSEAMQRIDQIAIDIAAHYGMVSQPEGWKELGGNARVGPQDRAFAMPRYLNNRAASIYGGSNEIQRGIIARQILGL